MDSHTPQLAEGQTPAPDGLTAEQQSGVAKARAYARELQETVFKDVVAQELVRRAAEAQPAASTVNPGLRSGVDARTLSVLSRVYVGSINFELTEEHMRRVFGEFGSVCSVSMARDTATGRHKGFGFVEFDVPEAAALAMDSMDGTMLGGRALRLGRPNNYAQAVAQGFPRPPPERIYVANVNRAVSEQVLREIFTPFGDVTECVLASNVNTREHMGWGFVEFAKADAAVQAAQAMNGLELAAMVLRVRACVVGGPLGPGMAALDAEPSVAQSDHTGPAVQSDHGSAVQSDHSVAQPDHTGLPARPDHSGSTVVVLSNVVGGRADVDDDLASDMAGEGTKCGLVRKVVVHIATQAELEELQEVCVFVEYAEHEAARRAIELFDGRWFGGRRVAAALFGVDLFRKLTSSDTMVFIP
ncbi:hypothetical protein IWW56_005999 [Coemansia sp. RSA 2131]|nr:hypothetical protein IWW56_005999 [Coemansia sp. RSA 2131]